MRDLSAVYFLPYMFQSHVAVYIFVLAAAVLALQGCGLSSLFGAPTACDLGAMYSLVRLDGRASMNRSALHEAGVRFCARHLMRPETYANGGCMDPLKLFPDGKLPSYNHADQHALLLVTCPNAFASDGSDVQRVTCSDDFVGEDDYGELRKEPRLHFNNDDFTDCRTGRFPEELPAGSAGRVAADGMHTAEAAHTANATSATNSTNSTNSTNTNSTIATNSSGATISNGIHVRPHEPLPNISNEEFVRLHVSQPNISSRPALGELKGEYEGQIQGGAAEDTAASVAGDSANVSASATAAEAAPPRRRQPRRQQQFQAVVDAGGASHLSLHRHRETPEETAIPETGLAP